MFLNRKCLHIGLSFILLIFFLIRSYNVFSQDFFLKDNVSYLIKVLNNKNYEIKGHPIDVVILDSHKNYLDSYFSLSFNRIIFFNNYLFYKNLPFSSKNWEIFPIKVGGQAVGYIFLIANSNHKEKLEVIMEALVYIGYAD